MKWEQKIQTEPESRWDECNATTVRGRRCRQDPSVNEVGRRAPRLSVWASLMKTEQEWRHATRWLHQSLPRLNLPNLSLDIPHLSMNMPHSWVWHFEAGLGHQTHGTGLARKEGSICDHKSVRLWTFPVHPVLEVKKENSEMEYKRFYNIDGVNRR